MTISRTGLPKLVAAMATATVAAAVLGAAPAQADTSPAHNRLQLQNRLSTLGRETASPNATTTSDPVVRIAGDDRIETAITASYYWDDADSTDTEYVANAVVLARSDQYADALAGVPLASAARGPLLLTAPTALDPRTEDEIQRVLAPGKTVYVLGGTGALSASVASKLAGDGYVVKRLAGTSRVETAVAIADQIETIKGGLNFAILATGLSFADALAAGPAAGSYGGVVLLTNDGSMPEETQAFLDDHEGLKVYTAGGPAEGADSAAEHITGQDRFQTATKIAQLFWDGTSSATTVQAFGLATAYNFPDALSGGALAAVLHSPMLLTTTASLNATTGSYLTANKSTIVVGFVMGGTGVVSDKTLNQAQYDIN